MGDGKAWRCQADPDAPCPSPPHNLRFENYRLSVTTRRRRVNADINLNQPSPDPRFRVLDHMPGRRHPAYARRPEICSPFDPDMSFRRAAAPYPCLSDADLAVLRRKSNSVRRCFWAVRRAPCPIRTDDLPLTRRLLWPAELRGRRHPRLTEEDPPGKAVQGNRPGFRRHGDDRPGHRNRPESLTHVSPRPRPGPSRPAAAIRADRAASPRPRYCAPACAARRWYWPTSPESARRADNPAAAPPR